MKPLFALAAILTLAGCSHNPPVQTTAYAKLSDHRTFEYDFPTTWKAIESTMRNNKVTERDPDDVDDLELRKLTHRMLQTDWIYTQSRDKYVEYTVNGSPRRQPLQARVRYRIDAQSQIGGTTVTVKTWEEIEQIKSDGTPDGYASSDQPDSSRASEVLDRINSSLLSAPPTGQAP